MTTTLATHSGRCWVCGEPFSDDDPVIYSEGLEHSGYIHRMCFLKPIIAEARRLFNEKHNNEFKEARHEFDKRSLVSNPKEMRWV